MLRLLIQGECISSVELTINKNDASILVVGNQKFITTFVKRTCYIKSSTVEVSWELDDVIQLIKTRQPAILILQATQVASLQLCRQIKEQKLLGWIYCIVINDLPEIAIETMGRDPNWELKECAQALENGADAYLRISSISNQDSAISVAEHRLLKAQIHAGLRGVQLYRKAMHTNDFLSRIALVDPLTELSNRRAMEWELPRQVENAFRKSTPLSLIILDVDYFKSINDNYGHPVGDRALKLLASRLKHNLRIQDSLFRYGGEEFVIILSHTDTQEARAVANRVRHIISDQPFHIDRRLVLPITISLGVASLNKNKDDHRGESLLRCADQNLRIAKSNGRNRVYCCCNH
ncbi:diguanylate cyclase [Moorena sp. SIO4G3]|uniref:GGDEF domain-containing protein n=1 Tax=Moorena sp. SIO4G3 TaxID=2607821 RepID=UPI0025E19753|nr:diguanylate cyclase [Moorena sp. SIO4G3]